MAFKTRIGSLACGFLLAFALSACEDITPFPQQTVVTPTGSLTLIQPAEPLPTHSTLPNEIIGPEVSLIHEVPQSLPEAPTPAPDQFQNLSSDATLSNLALSPIKTGSPFTFSRDTLSYSTSINNETGIITVTPTVTRAPNDTTPSNPVLKRRPQRPLPNPGRAQYKNIAPLIDSLTVAPGSASLPIPIGSGKNGIKVGAIAFVAAGFSIYVINSEWLNNRLSDRSNTRGSRPLNVRDIRDSYCALVNQDGKYWEPNSFCRVGDETTVGILNPAKWDQNDLNSVLRYLYAPADTSTEGFRLDPLDLITSCELDPNGEDCKNGQVSVSAMNDLINFVTQTLGNTVEAGRDWVYFFIGRFNYFSNPKKER